MLKQQDGNAKLLLEGITMTNVSVFHCDESETAKPQEYSFSLDSDFLHNKTGNLYRVLGVCERVQGSSSPLVIYCRKADYSYYHALKSTYLLALGTEDFRLYFVNLSHSFATPIQLEWVQDKLIEDKLFARPVQDFFGGVELDGKIVPRFEESSNKVDKPPSDLSRIKPEDIHDWLRGLAEEANAEEEENEPS